MNALAFSGTNFLFSKVTDNGEKERKKHDLALEKIQVPQKYLSQSQLSDFCHPSEGQKNGKLLFVTVGTCLTPYAIYKYLK